MTTAANGRVTDGGRGTLVAPLLFIALVVAVLGSLGAPLITAVAQEYRVSLAAAQWSLTIALLSGAVTTPLLGRLGSVRRRPVVVATLAIVTAGSVATVAPVPFAVLLAGRAAQGIGLGLTPLMMATARQHLGERAPSTIALLSVASTAGVGLGYPAAGLLAQVGGVRAAYLLGVVITAAALATAIVALPRDRPAPPRERRDVPPDRADAQWSGADAAQDDAAVSRGRADVVRDHADESRGAVDVPQDGAAALRGGPGASPARIDGRCDHTDAARDGDVSRDRLDVSHGGADASQDPAAASRSGPDAPGERADVPAEGAAAPRGGSVDWLGTSLLSLGLVAVLLVTSQTALWLSEPTVAGLVLAAGVVLLAGWVVVERRVSRPLVDLAALRHPAVAAANLIMAVSGIAMYLLFTLITRYVQTPRQAGYGYGLTAVEAGLVLVPFSLLGFAAGRVVPRLQLRTGPFVLLAVCGVVITAGCVLFAGTRTWGVAWPIVAMGVLGFGVGGASATMPQAILAMTPARETAAAMSVNQVVRAVGFSIGSAVGGLILAAHTTAGQFVPASAGYTTAAWIAAALAVVGIATAVGADVIRRRRPSTT